MRSQSKRRSLLGDRVLALVTEEWQDIERVMERAIPMVPPGKALRTYQATEAKNAAARAKRIANGKKVIAQRPPPTEAERIERGARSVVNDLLGSAREYHTVEVKVGKTRRQRMIRLDPARRYSHHCCLHGGSCAATDDRQPEPEETAGMTATAVNTSNGTATVAEGETMMEWLERQGMVERHDTEATPIIPRHPYPEHLGYDDHEEYERQ